MRRDLGLVETPEQYMDLGRRRTKGFIECWAKTQTFRSSDCMHMTLTDLLASAYLQGAIDMATALERRQQNEGSRT